MDIFDYDIQGGRGTGIYWKKWCVYFELGRLEIDAADEILDEQRFPETFPTYWGYFFFEKDFKDERIYMNTDIDEFIADAMNYKSYITEGLKEIEVDIDILEEFIQRRDAQKKEPPHYSVEIDLWNKDMIKPW